MTAQFLGMNHVTLSPQGYVRFVPFYSYNWVVFPWKLILHLDKFHFLKISDILA